MFNNLLPLLVALIASGSVLLFFYAALLIARTIPKDERLFMDPLPLAMRIMWPLINFFAHYFGERLGVEYLEKIRVRLKRAGLGFLLTPQQFFGFKLICALVSALLGWFVLSALGAQAFHVLLVVLFIGFLLPELNLYERKKKIDKDIVRALPVYLDFLTMSVEAGMNLNGAIMQAVQQGPKGHLNYELQWVIRDIKAGSGKIEALQKMEDRLQIQDITSLVAALTHADKTGSMIGQTLRIQADQKRIERFQHAEKLAMQAPVKLVGPLVLFIFPTTFIIIFFPIVTQLIDIVGQ